MSGKIETTDGLPGKVVKFTVGEVDCYFTIGLDEGRPVFFSMVVSGGPNRNPLLEVVFNHAMRMLERGDADLSYLVRSWRGTHFEPNGPCPQLRAIVSSPLDAAARYLERYVPTP